MATEFQIVSHSDIKSFQDDLSILVNKRNYIPHGEMTTTSVVVEDAHGDDAIVTTYSILLQRTV